MKYKMPRFRDSKDANLLVGAVLLIAAMVVISIAVDAWTGNSHQFSQVEECTISSFTFSSDNTINVVVENNGTIPFQIAEVWINKQRQAFTENSTIIPPKECIDLSVSYTYSNGTTYNFKIISERGSIYLFTATAL
jgi:hypothetical protein